MTKPVFKPVTGEKQPPPISKEEKPEEAVNDLTLRNMLGEALVKDRKKLDFIVETLMEACEPTLKYVVRDHECDKCGCKHFKTLYVRRHKEAVDLTIKLMDQVEGRPGTAEAGGQGVTVTRIVVGLDE